MSEGQPEQERTYVASVKTALSGPEENITKKLPSTYLDSTVAEVLAYLTDRKQLEEEELTTARSIQAEMSRDYTVSVNSSPAKAEDRVTGLFEPKTHRGVEYQSLEMEISSVQEGGLAYLLG